VLGFINEADETGNPTPKAGAITAEYVEDEFDALFGNADPANRTARTVTSVEDSLDGWYSGLYGNQWTPGKRGHAARSKANDHMSPRQMSRKLITC
jgi:hypothetical protein